MINSDGKRYLISSIRVFITALTMVTLLSSHARENAWGLITIGLIAVLVSAGLKLMFEAFFIWKD